MGNKASSLYQYKENQLPVHEPLVVVEGGVKIHYIKGKAQNENLLEAIPFRKKQLKSAPGTNKLQVEQRIAQTEKSMKSQGLSAENYAMLQKQTKTIVNSEKFKERVQNGYIIVNEQGERHQYVRVNDKSKIVFVKNRPTERIPQLDLSNNSPDYFIREQQKHDQKREERLKAEEDMEAELYALLGFDRNGAPLQKEEVAKSETASQQSQAETASQHAQEETASKHDEETASQQQNETASQQQSETESQQQQDETASKQESESKHDEEETHNDEEETASKQDDQPSEQQQPEAAQGAASDDEETEASSEEESESDEDEEEK